MGQAIELFGLRCAHRMAAERVGEIMIYSSIVRYKWDEADPEMTALDFDKALKELKDVDRLNLRMNCPGGSVHQAVAMRAMLAGYPAAEKHIYIEGLCASAATLIASVPGCVVHITEGSEYMIHNPSDYAFGDANAMEAVVRSLRNTEKDCYAMYARKSGQDEATIKQWMDETKWFGAKEAVEAGFADELLEATGDRVASAAVSAGDMRLMRALYAAVPEAIAVRQEEAPPAPPEPAEPAGATMSDAPVAEDAPPVPPTREESEPMDMKDMTLEELQAAQPALLQSARETAIQEERQRMQDIDELTPPGEDYAQMAAAAKAEGTSALDFHKRVLAAQKDKSAAFLAQRRQETEPAAQVPGGASEDDAGDEEQRMEADAKEIAAFAKACHDTGVGAMY